MAGWSDVEEKAILGWYFNADAKTPDTPLYLGLFSTAPADGDTGATLWDKEVQVAEWDTYARISIASSGGNWTVAAGDDPSVYSNANLLQFVEMGSGTGVTVTHWALLSAQALDSGLLIFHGVLAGSLAVSAGVQPQFNVGALELRLGG